MLLLGGTTNAILKLAKELSDKKPFKDVADRFQAQCLIVDEASMMVFPHFLSLATLVEPSGEIMLAGDHRQLAPIVAHDWEREDRPPAVVYQPYVSAYIAVQNITGRPGIGNKAVRRTALNYSFRLPPVIRELLSRLYKLDDIELDGIPLGAPISEKSADSWKTIWAHGAGLYLVLHKERQSRQSNTTESEIIKEILSVAPRWSMEAWPS
ncbi:MAG: AAA family ATPase [Edaphobacter sp.]